MRRFVEQIDPVIYITSPAANTHHWEKECDRYVINVCVFYSHFINGDSYGAGCIKYCYIYFQMMRPIKKKSNIAPRTALFVQFGGYLPCVLLHIVYIWQCAFFTHIIHLAALWFGEFENVLYTLIRVYIYTRRFWDWKNLIIICVIFYFFHFWWIEFNCLS